MHIKHTFFPLVFNLVIWRGQNSRNPSLMHWINCFFLMTVSDRTTLTHMIECISHYISVTLARVVQYQEVHNVTLGVPLGYAVIIWNEYFNYVAASDKWVFCPWWSLYSWISSSFSTDHETVICPGCSLSISGLGVSPGSWLYW